MVLSSHILPSLPNEEKRMKSPIDIEALLVWAYRDRYAELFR